MRWLLLLPESPPFHQLEVAVINRQRVSQVHRSHQRFHQSLRALWVNSGCFFFCMSFSRERRPCINVPASNKSTETLILYAGRESIRGPTPDSPTTALDVQSHICQPPDERPFVFHWKLWIMHGSPTWRKHARITGSTRDGKTSDEERDLALHMAIDFKDAAFAFHVKDYSTQFLGCQNSIVNLGYRFGVFFRIYCYSFFYSVLHLRAI